MVATLNIVEQNNRWLASLQTMIDLQAWRGWYMQPSSMPKSNSDVRTTPSRVFAAVYCFSQAIAFQEPLDAPCLHKLKGGGAADYQDYISIQPNC